MEIRNNLKLIKMTQEKNSALEWQNQFFQKQIAKQIEAKNRKTKAMLEKMWQQQSQPLKKRGICLIS